MTPTDRDDRAARLEQAIRLKKAAARTRTPDIDPRPSDEPALIGEMQRSLWLVHQMDRSSPAYNLTSLYRIDGDLDPTRLETAFSRVMARHRLLRSTFHARSEGVVQIEHPPSPLAVEVVEAADDEGLETAVREARRPFDLESGPLVRLRLIEESSGGSRYLLVVLHHILADERSLARLWSEVADGYEGRLAEEPPPVQYDDFVHWLDRRDPSERDRELDFWRERLDPLPEDLALPFENPASAGEPGGRLLRRTLKEEVRHGIHRLAAETGSTPFMVSAAAFRMLLQRYTGDRRVAFATPVSTRSHPATAEMIGYFTNPVVVTDRVDEDRPVAAAVREFGVALREALSHGSVPFPALAEALSPPRVPDRHPVFQTMFVYQQSDPGLTLGAATLEPVILDLGAAKFDLTLFVSEGESSLEIAVEYRSDRFDERWMEQLLGHFETLLTELPADLDRPASEVPIMAPDEEQALRQFAAGPELETDGRRLIPVRILEIAERNPLAPALLCGDVRRSYGELGTAARRIAHRLVSQGVTPGDRVAVYLDRSVTMIEAVVGVHLAGAGYVPLDPSYPAARTRFVLDDADVAAVVTRSALRDSLPEGPWSVVETDADDGATAEISDLSDVEAESVAYVLYTSGSTGTPKGVVVSHENLQLSTDARLQAYDRPPGRYLLLPSIAFDSSVAGIFWTLATAGTLVIPTDEEARDIRRLARLVANEEVSSLLCVPSLYAQLLRTAADDLQTLEMAIVAGESCPSRLVGDHFRSLPKTRLYNEYGPTEATVWATIHRMTEEDSHRPVSIGRPIPGVRIEVVDNRGRRLPAGVPGDAWIAGPTVAQGYWRRPDLTEDRFVDDGRDDPFARRYRSGDRVAWSADGRLMFLGRDDQQIKLRGYRIEPGEIEAALLELAGVDQAVVVARPIHASAAPSSRSEDAQLVAFVTGISAEEADGWRSTLAERLPDFMIPARLVPMAELPKLPNGKVDRQRLLDMKLDSEAPGRSPGVVMDTAHETLIALWEGLLGVDGIGPDDNFFELGGHSLLVVEMALAIERDFEVSLSAADVFANPTVRGLARHIGRRGEPDSRPYEHLFPIQPSGSEIPFVVAIPHFFTRMFADRFRGERPVYGLRGIGHRAEGNLGRWRTMTELAEDLVEEIQRRFGDTEVIIAGYSFGASMAVEAVRLMEARGHPVRRLYLVAPMAEDFYRIGPLRLQLDGLREPPDELPVWDALRRYAASNNPLTRRPYQRVWRWFAIEPWRRLLCLLGKARRRLGLPLTESILWADVRVDRFRLHAGYRPGPIRTPTVFFNAVDTETDAAATWRPVFQGPFTVHPTPDPHHGEDSVEAAKKVILEHLGDLED